MTPHTKRRLQLGILLSGAFLLTACPTGNSGSGGNKTTETPASSAAPAPLERKVRVRLLAPQYGLLTSQRSVSVQLSPRRSASVAAQASGPVSSVLVSEGDRVEAGQTVLRLESTGAQNSLNDARLALETARLNLQKAESGQSGNLRVAQQSARAAQENVDLTEKRLRDTRELFQAGGAAAIDVQQLEVSLSQARSTLSSAQDQVARAGRSQDEDLALLRVQVSQAQNRVTSAEKTLRDTEVKAPFAGVISDLNVQQGEFLGSGARAFVLADTSALEGKFRLPPEQADALEDGTTLSLEYAGTPYNARLERRSVVPGQDRQVELTVRLQSADIPVGATATLVYRLKLAQGFLAPSGAVRTDSSGQSVVFASTSGKATPTPVRIRGEAEGKVALEGLAKGQQIVFPLPGDVVGGETLEVVK